jgi:hypothetical protein
MLKHRTFLISFLALQLMGCAEHSSTGGIAPKLNGNETLNGEEQRVPPQFLNSQKWAVDIVDRYQLGNSIPEDNLTDELRVYLAHSAQWKKVLEEAPVVRAKGRLYEGGLEVGILADTSAGTLVINSSYFREQLLSNEETVVLIIHEAGHLVGIQDHALLDKIGNQLVGLR